VDQINDSTPPIMAYVAGKTVGEKKFWELSEQHKDVDFTSSKPSSSCFQDYPANEAFKVVPPGIYGPLLKTFPRPDNRFGLGTVDSAYRLITGETEPNTWPDNPVGNVVHVADVAKAHVLALTAPPLKDGRKKRLIVAAGVLHWKEAADLLRKERPELISRLPRPDLTPNPQSFAPLDTSLTEEVLGIKTWLSSEQAFLESIDSALEWEKGETKA